MSELVPVNSATLRAADGTGGVYTQSQFEGLFQIVREVVADEMAVESQPLFVPIRRLIGLFKTARAIAERERERGITTIGLLEQALHAVDVMMAPRGQVQTNRATVEVMRQVEDLPGE